MDAGRINLIGLAAKIWLWQNNGKTNSNSETIGDRHEQQISQGRLIRPASIHLTKPSSGKLLNLWSRRNILASLAAVQPFLIFWQLLCMSFSISDAVCWSSATVCVQGPHGWQRSGAAQICSLRPSLPPTAMCFASQGVRKKACGREVHTQRGLGQATFTFEYVLCPSYSEPPASIKKKRKNKKYKGKIN